MCHKQRPAWRLPRRYYETWAAAVAHERQQRRVREARALYRRGYSRKLEEGGQLAFCADWLKFEQAS